MCGIWKRNKNPFGCMRIWVFIVCVKINWHSFISLGLTHFPCARDSIHFVLVSCAAAVVVFIFRNWNIMFCSKQHRIRAKCAHPHTHMMHLIQFICFSLFNCSYLSIGLFHSRLFFRICSVRLIFSLQFISFSKFRFHQTIALRWCKHEKCVIYFTYKQTNTRARKNTRGKISLHIQTIKEILAERKQKRKGHEWNDEWN